MATVKCRFCHKELDKATAYNPSRGMYYCNESCYQQAQDRKNHHTQKNYKSAKGTKREDCTDYIQLLYMEKGYTKSNIPWVLVGSQLKNILDNNPTWKYSGIKLTLQYMHKTLGMDMFYNTGTPLNLVEYYYDEAKDWWIECRDIAKDVDEFEFDDETKVVKKNTFDDKKYKINTEF